VSGDRRASRDRARSVVAGVLTLLSVLAPWSGRAAPAVVDLQRVDWSAVEAPSAGLPRVIGTYGAACLAGAAALPLLGDGYQVVETARRRYYGHPQLIAFVLALAKAALTQQLGVLLVGDLAQPRGGPMSSGHVSHQGGLDVDISYQFDRPDLSPAERDLLAHLSAVVASTDQPDPALWTDRQAALVHQAALDPRVARVFVAAAIKRDLCQRTWPDRRWLGLVRPWPGHEDHLHVRLRCPADSPACIEQPPSPAPSLSSASADVGCGPTTLQWALARDRAERLRPPRRPNRHVPRACAAVITAPGQNHPPAYRKASD
jgi:penicillin-insensitive murein endopeptidase